MAASSACIVMNNGLSTHNNTKQNFSKVVYGRNHFLSSRFQSLGKTSKTLLVRAALDRSSHHGLKQEGRRGFLKKLLGNVGIVAPSLLGSGKAYADDQGVSSSRMSYSRFLEYLDKDRVKKVDLFENGTIAIVEAVSPELGNRVQRVRVQLPGLSQELLQKFREKNIDFAAHNAQEDSGSLLFNLIGNLAFPLILIGGLFLLSRRSSGGMGGPGGPGFPLAFGQSKAKFQMEPNTGVTFDDVAGVDEAKQDFMEVVEFLKKPERFTAVGARIPKGVLLVGPPGTGKTLLAKAIAGEAGVPFFSISGSEFVEMFVGVGASRVRDLFKKAKENAPCIVFVDEIDAVGRQRGTGIGGGNDEREQTLNQLLTEMDGFEGNTGIIVIAATNRADILDSALLRPGRFDRQVTVDVPDIRGRTEILKVHAGNKKFDADVSLDIIAMRTPGFSGADLANLLNEAAILAGRRGKTAISSKEIDDSIDRIVAGMEGTVMTDGKSKSLVAYHEVGHAICGTLTPGHDAVQKVTLIPRGQARGLTWFIPADDPTLISKQQLFARIVGGLGGRAAEEVIFGEPEVTTGAAGDLQQITGLAKQMVTTFGMSEIGPWSLMDSSAQSADVIMRMMARNSMSERLAEDIDSAIKRLSDSAYEIALSHIRNNREAIDKIVEVLLEKETMTGDEFRAILSEFVEIPAENRVPPSVSTPVTV
ncbi:ATP-dependent zinc metalloprotease FTSH 2, chloroplastic [Ricinus communis]|uniref:Cell division protein ftsH, putative n=1 Tax=Ricinus communis TaxID=3988 RepID=B9S304_RICCO|nr:ATP-dependent zinc metalloprotease FTSH 2, chloroplastic [Ricinus communis]XP_048230099.1 ATP-dependent zinc metalloprotease FTSH 2, chloroplastic [Ricinus communis]EEF41989.1 Cell division protein ftsH, putative [Ricinus communis]|eukprot:XP_002520373.1 ATP-dependent zinc metalloprotease FTSH 2, chloroplastic [Ricinus communis]